MASNLRRTENLRILKTEDLIVTDHITAGSAYFYEEVQAWGNLRLPYDGALYGTYLYNDKLLSLKYDLSANVPYYPGGSVATLTVAPVGNGPSRLLFNVSDGNSIPTKTAMWINTNRDIYANGNLFVGGSTNSNSILFRGTLLDDQTLYTQTIISDRRYDISGNNEKSELLLFKADNTTGSSAGPDRVRVASAGGFQVDITSGIWQPGVTAGPTVSVPNCINVNSAGNVGIRTNNQAYPLDISGSVRVGGNLFVGGSTSINTIRFRGTEGDDQQLYRRTIIADRIYSGVENSELLLYKGDDSSNADKVRVAATGGFQVDVASGAWEPSGTTAGPIISVANCINVNSNGNIGIRRNDPGFTFDVSGNARVTGSLFASGVTIANGGVKTFRIPHPVLPDTELIHSCIEGPRADLIYRGRKRLSGGSVTVDLNRESTGNGATMADGTFEALCANPQVFVTNNDTWDRVRGAVTGATLTITAESPAADCWVDWMVVAERKDATIKASPLTDADGFLILEHRPVKKLSM